MFSVVIYPPVFRDQEAQLQLQLVAGGCRIQRRGTEWRQRRQRRRGPGGTHGPQSLLTHRFPPRRVLRRKQKKKQEVKKKCLDGFSNFHSGLCLMAAWLDGGCSMTETAGSSVLLLAFPVLETGKTSSHQHAAACCNTSAQLPTQNPT